MSEILKKKFINLGIYNFFLINIITLTLYVYFKYEQHIYLYRLDYYAILITVILFIFIIISFNNKYSKNLILFLIPPLFIFFIFEFFLGNFFSSTHTTVKKFKNTTFIQKNIWYNSDNNKFDKISININKYGLRGKLKENSLDGLDILFVGGSTTIQSTITDGYTFIDILEKNFHSKLNKKLYFLNGGEDAHNTKSHILSLNNRFAELNLKPKYIFFFIGHNEGIDRNNRDTNDRYLKTSNPLILKMYGSSFLINKFSEARVYLGTLILDPSRFYKWHLHGYVPLESDLLNKNYRDIDLDKNFEKKLIKEIDIELTALKKNIAKLAHIVKEDYNATPIFMNMAKASYYKKNNKIRVFYKPLVPKYFININHNHDNRINYYFTKVVADKTYLSCREISFAICIDLFNEGDLEISDFHDFSHFKPSGAKKIADLLFKKLKNNIIE